MPGANQAVVSESGRDYNVITVVFAGAGTEVRDLHKIAGSTIKHIQRIIHTSAAAMTFKIRRKGQPGLSTDFSLSGAIVIPPGATDIERVALARDNLMIQGLNIEITATAAGTATIEVIHD